MKLILKNLHQLVLRKNKLKFSVTVTLKKDVLDPQGKVVGQTLKSMGIKNLNQIRQGKFFEIDLNINDKIEGETQVKQMCERLLANQIIEDFKIQKSFLVLLDLDYSYPYFLKFDLLLYPEDLAHLFSK